MSELIKKVPLSLSGLMLAIAGLGRLGAAFGDGFVLACAALAVASIILLIGKVIGDANGLRQDLQNPIQAAIAGTFSMGLLVLAGYLAPWSLAAGRLVWFLGLSLHLLVLGWHAWRFIRPRTIAAIFPATFIPFVGILAACTSAAPLGLAEAGQAIFWFGLASYLALLPVIAYRTLVVKGIPEAAQPTIAIFAAPASLCLLACLSVFDQAANGLVLGLAALALASTLAVLPLLPRLFGRAFHPSLAAFGFPFVVSTLAMKKLSGFLAGTFPGEVAAGLALAETILALGLAAVILARYLVFLAPRRPAPVKEAEDAALP